MMTISRKAVVTTLTAIFVFTKADRAEVDHVRRGALSKLLNTTRRFTQAFLEDCECPPTTAGLWEQIGSTISPIEDTFPASVSMSGKGDRVLVRTNNTLHLYDTSYGGGSWSLRHDFADYVEYDNPLLPAGISLNGKFVFVKNPEDQEPNVTETEFRAGSVIVLHEDTNGDWVKLGQTIRGEVWSFDDPNVQGEEFFGLAVGITGDGEMIFVGTGVNVYVFKLSKGKWTLEQKLVHPPTDPTGNFGLALAVASDGSTLIISMYDNVIISDDDDISTDDDSGRKGSVFIYTTPSYDFFQKIDGSGENDALEYVSISSDGSCFVGGSIYGNYTQIYKLASDGTEYIAVGGPIPCFFIFLGSFSLSPDGSRLAVGVPLTTDLSDENFNFTEDFNSTIGKTNLYDIKENTWNSTGEILGNTTNNFSGISVALSEDGNRIAIVALTDFEADTQENDPVKSVIRVFENLGGI